jgi:hypothetical protein
VLITRQSSIYITDMVDELVALDIYCGSKQCQVAEILHSESNNHLLRKFRTDRPLHVSELPTKPCSMQSMAVRQTEPVPISSYYMQSRMLLTVIVKR